MIVTAKQYAEILGVSQSSITKKMKALREMGKPISLPGVSKIEKWGNTWRFELSKKLNKETDRIKFRNLLVNSN